MSYFPMFYNLDGKKILIVGAGNIALQKLEKLLGFTESITIIAERFSEEMRALALEHGLIAYNKTYESRDLDGFDVVIGAVDDIPLQKRIFEDARMRKVLCNCVDATEYCDFLFPSFFKRKELIVAVSSSGVTPSLAKGLREHFESLIPDEIDGFIEEVAQIRQTMPKGQERQKKLIELSHNFLNRHFKR